MKKKLLIIGGVLVVGAGAYLLLRTKNSDEGKFFKIEGTEPVYKVVKGELIHVPDAATMDKLMIETYGDAEWRVEKLPRAEFNKRFPNAKLHEKSLGSIQTISLA